MSSDVTHEVGTTAAGIQLDGSKVLKCLKMSRCCGCLGTASADDDGTPGPVIVGDTCSGCHFAALEQSVGGGDYQVTFASFHVDVAETPFFVAVDYDHQSVVVSIRGTISMKVTNSKQSITEENPAAVTILFPPSGHYHGPSRRSRADPFAAAARRLVWAQSISATAVPHPPESFFLNPPF